jgi:hypothetical protein
VADYVPFYENGVQPFTATTSAAVTGGRVLAASGNGTVAHAGAASAVAVGVAAHDAPSGGQVTVWPLEGVVHELQAASAVTALAAIETAAAGEVATAAAGAAATAGSLQTVIGVALTTAAGSPLKLRVLGRRG